MHTGNVAAAALSAGDPLLLLAGASTAAPLIASGSSSAGADAQQGTMTLASAAVAQARRGAETDIGFSVPAPYVNLAAKQPATVDGQHVPAGSWTPSISYDCSPGDYRVDIDAGGQSPKTTARYDAVAGLVAPSHLLLVDSTL